jgi:hypothetical protein
MANKDLEIRELTPDEWGPHQPPDDDERWQESWGSSWHDPIRRAGGINHISIWRNRGVADVWSWVALDGKVVGKYQSLNLPVPEQDFPNWSAGGQNITTEDGRHCRMYNTYENAQTDVRFSAFTDPLAFPVDAEGNTWGASHYEAIGRVDGTVTVGGEATTVSGFGWQDHSWGPRRWADTMSHRWIMAGFGPDLFVTALQIVTESSPTPIPIGVVYDHGTLHRVQSGTFGTRMHDDGHSPAGCDAYLWTEAGNGYHITGEVHTSSPSSHIEGFWFTDGLCTYECGGRLGAGILEVQELNRPAPWTRDVLGLDLPDALPAYA